MDQSTLKSTALSCASKITTESKDRVFKKTPFKYMFIDNFVDENFAETLINSFPSTNDLNNWDYANDESIEVKYRSKWESEFDIPENISDMVRILNSSIVLKAISLVLDIPKLMPDPYFSGGGLNVTEKGGYLDVHVDGNYHDASGLNRRVNAILYLNKNWNKSYGGEFGVYSSDGSECVDKIAPLFNRLVIFDTHDKSFHGLPNPVEFPKNSPRRSIILYYYTKASRPSNQITVEKPHSALWKSKGLVDKKGNTTRDFN